MNYEQKYKEVLERAQKELQTCGSADCDAAKQIFRFFPELKESEEEKTRKELIRYLPYCDDISKDTKERWIAWLEKQGDEPNWCHHKVDLSNCSEEYRKAYYDGWNNCNQQHAQLEAQRKPTWSEEDEKMISLLIKIFEINHPNGHFKVNPIGTTNMEAMSTKEILDWLKSLKPQNHWKPSEEQMQALFEAKLASINNREYFLGLLYDDLKKL